MQASQQFDFLIDYVLRLLEDNNIHLTEEQQKTYVPQLMGQVQLRLGIALLPKLSPENKDKFAVMAENEETSADEWRVFWYAAILTFEEDVKGVLNEFAARVGQLLNKV